MKRTIGVSNMQRAARVGRRLICSALLLCGSAALAEPPPQNSKAFEAYGRGQRLFGQHDYAAAQVAFEEAYAAVPNPVVLLGIAESQQRLGLLADAVATLERYLRERPKAPDKARIDEQIASMRSALALPTSSPARESSSADVTMSPITVINENRMSSTFELVRAVYSIDGTPVVSKVNLEEGLDPNDAFDMSGATIAPGVHMLTVDFEYRGRSYGLFSYLDAYRYKVRSSHAFSTSLGHAVEIRIIAYEHGGPTVPREHRPDVRYVERTIPGSGGAAAEGKGPSLAQTEAR